MNACASRTYTLTTESGLFFFTSTQSLPSPSGITTVNANTTPQTPNNERLSPVPRAAHGAGQGQPESLQRVPQPDQRPARHRRAAVGPPRRERQGLLLPKRLSQVQADEGRLPATVSARRHGAAQSGYQQGVSIHIGD